MKILFFGDLGGNLGDYIRSARIRDYLKSKGDDVYILDLRPEYKPRSKLFRHFDILKIIISGKIGLEKTELIKDKALWKLGKKILNKKIRTHNPDLIWCERTELGFIAIDTVGDDIPVITDVHGIISKQYEEDPFLNVINERLEFLKYMENVVFSESSVCIACSNPMKNYIAEKHKIDRKKIPVIPNGSTIRKKRAEYREPLRVIYGGAFEFYENIDSYLDLVKNNQRCMFYLAGSGSLKKHISKRIKNEKIDLRYLGHLPRARAIEVFLSMNVGVAPLVNTTTGNISCPVKVFDYLSCGLPVITPDYGEWAKIISKNKCGFVTKTSSGKEFNEYLNILDKDTWHDMSSNGLRLIKEEYNWNILLKKIDRILEGFS